MSDSSADHTAAAPKRNLLQTLEIDTRLLGMIGAFIVISLAFQLWTGFRAVSDTLNPFAWLLEGRFLTPRNIFNLTIQTASVAIMAAGMVFVIVMRHIDLSVGAILAITSATMALLQVRYLPNVMGLDLGHPMLPWIAIISGIAVGALIGAFNGWLIGYQGVPAFIVTLGGFLVWRNVGLVKTDGATLGPLDPTFQVFGGINGTLGTTWSWIFGAFAVSVSIWLLFSNRKMKAKHGFLVKPIWAELTTAGILSAAILGFVAILNAYKVPELVIARDFLDYGCETADKCSAGYGLPLSVFVVIVVAIIMTVIAKRTRLGRYIFATGGNPTASELSGINTRMLTVKVFMIMGILCAIAAIVASARQNYHTNDIGTLDELRVIAAAVIGGTALAGGVGTIYGAILGALIMQSLQSGMAMVGVDTPFQNIVVGTVLVLAVWIDIKYRKRTGAA